MAASLVHNVIRGTSLFIVKLPRQGLRALSTKDGSGRQQSPNVSDGSGIAPDAGERALTGFAKALEKAKEAQKLDQEHAAEDGTLVDTETEHATFAAMLRHSKLMQLGDTVGRMVLGQIIEVVDDDLYIDIGGKFHCVCPRPKLNPDRYHRGVKVKVRVNDLEMSSSFLGSQKHITLLEADGTLIGLRRQSSATS